MVAQPTKGPRLEDLSNQQKVGKNWMIAQPTKCPQLEGSSNQQKKRRKLDYCPTDKMHPIRSF